MNICRQCFRERSAQIGFEKVRTRNLLLHSRWEPWNGTDMRTYLAALNAPNDLAFCHESPVSPDYVGQAEDQDRREDVVVLVMGA